MATNASVVVAVSANSVSTECPVVTTFMKRGATTNSAKEVKKLQKFLNAFESAHLEVTGIFDEQTETAVGQFQEKYQQMVLAPWGGTKASGIVHTTTAQNINHIACGTPLTLNKNELSAMLAFKQNKASRIKQDQEVQDNQQSSVENSNTLSPRNNNDEELGYGVAAVGNISIMNKFWEFIKGLF